ncbi:hypothetical protein PHABIO_167 [Pseudomonas phage Phabio]|uniref:Uncharacterized protein n=1 Tax=Pseudomonas phage Phabio TaxID=2006668 RepID=A0A1Y0SZZ0_9CAUD|nr:hypothetical protein MZD05_gp167 [Pseudomonas phage Phabio]ARV76798.1 hypothetical protein PHABIO_167 [Pseudomonas phage Phabio]
MKLTYGDKVLIVGLGIGLFIGIIYSKVKYGLPLFQLF